MHVCCHGIGTGGYIHIFGTDADGRDLYSAIAYGLRISMAIGIISSAIALVVGTVFGLLAGFLGGRVESFIMRLIALQLSFPSLMLALVLVAALGQGKAQVVIALVTAQYAYFARKVHGTTFAESKRICGGGRGNVAALAPYFFLPSSVQCVAFPHCCCNSPDRQFHTFLSWNWPACYRTITWWADLSRL